MSEARESVQPRTVNSTAPERPKSHAVSYKALMYIGLSITLGWIAAMVLGNVQAGEQSTFSTPSLLAFLFGIGVSAASIVLAVTAIALGRLSEQVIVSRADESIRLQNEVFVRTTDALARIESSTGVTERRIEDIISGRAGDMSKSIAEDLEVSGANKLPDRKALEESIKESLLEQFSSERQQQRAAATRAKKEQMDLALTRYRAFQGSLLASIANARLCDCEKLGEGSWDASDESAVDGIVKCGIHRIGLSVMSAERPLSNEHFSAFPSFLDNAAAMLAKGSISHLFAVFNGPLASDGRWMQVVARKKAVMRADLAERIMIFEGEPELTTEGVLRTLAELADRPAPKLEVAG